ncbi:DNA polymerase/3'-5' exonuclease PolX [Candidatus Uhrbacteria bacterium]|nr:DNA polymerase/3'-5' exonuclease PolX [Candidatus Uhrbacteria bacterium]
MTNRDIAAVLREMALYYEMEGVAFKPAAYEAAADSIESSGLDAATLYEEGGRPALKKIPGVGEGISHHIEGLLKRGGFPEYRRLHKKYPIDVLTLTSIEDLGPKRAKVLYQKLKIKTLHDLERAATAGKIRTIPGFGVKTEEKFLKGIALKKSSHGRYLLGHILPIATKMEEELRRVSGVKHAVVAGSIRRRQETIGDIDILVTTSQPEKVMAVFVGFPEVAEVLEHGPTKTTVRLQNGCQADVRVIADESFGAALQYFTGSKEHNVVVRKMAIAKGLKLNEYGIWRGRKRLAAKTEEDVYKVLGLSAMPPEIRTASGEIEAAKKNRLPVLIPYGSVRGDLQTQTSWTDGEFSIAEMAAAAQALGLEYIAVTDHTRSLAMTGGLDEKKLWLQGREIDALNAKPSGFTILKGAEVNIMKDGSLDIDDEALKKLDVVGAAVHSHFKLSRAEQTARVIAAMKNPHLDVLFHPTGRIIGRREPIDLDIEAVIKAAKATGTAVEIDSYPDRSDLRDSHVRMAVELGVKLVIDTDAHATAHLKYLDLGVAIARRGWASTSDVLNTRPLAELLRWLRTPKNKRK